MSKSKETYNKRDKEKIKQRKRKEKENRKEDRKSNSDKGKSTEEMFAYVDHDGNITSTPPDPKYKKSIRKEDIQISISKKEAPEPAELVRQGIVTFFNESKGYGFIKDQKTQESIFVHVYGLESPVKENDKVTFETEKGPKGMNAVRVKLLA
jgi:cold shock CspA family protein